MSITAIAKNLAVLELSRYLHVVNKTIKGLSWQWKKPATEAVAFRCKILQNLTAALAHFRLWQVTLCGWADREDSEAANCRHWRNQPSATCWNWVDGSKELCTWGISASVLPFLTWQTEQPKVELMVCAKCDKWAIVLSASSYQKKVFSKVIWSVHLFCCHASCHSLFWNLFDLCLIWHWDCN